MYVYIYVCDNEKPFKRKEWKINECESIKYSHLITCRLNLDFGCDIVKRKLQN